MATFDIKPGFYRDFNLKFTKADGGRGEIEGIPEAVLSDAALATLTVDPDGMRGEVHHNGSTGPVTISWHPVDGDLGAGVHPIQIESHQFNMLPPLGAEFGIADIGEEVAIP